MQKINHFSAMLELCRKRHMARHFAALQRTLPQAYAFCPRTLQLPEQLPALVAELRGGGRKGAAWIVKPDAGCQGRGIVLVQTAKQARAVSARACAQGP